LSLIDLLFHSSFDHLADISIPTTRGDDFWVGINSTPLQSTPNSIHTQSIADVERDEIGWR
jgi:hypothetical protein